MSATVPHFYLLTVQLPTGGGFVTNTSDGTVDVPPGGTRRGVYDWALERLPDQWRSATVLFFSVEPSVLVPAPAGGPVRGRAV